ncbi:alcohol dehydrogenase AdhP [Paenibacillus beijingensis]|uniref:Alcohol dehydrogenase n=1 Tax=Paenibacillus beijingensis TaxID=1126833 RepID=A0A0D5NEA8_9BACL|nr:alcohol dehydrogenase AdhP [Paenibacillus beijingensis]AJY73495.1 alcohol dehydrogenase [Paenibacillus beijingensis]
MKAAVITEFGKPLEITDVPKPESLAYSECLIRIHVCGVCHTDLHVARGDWHVEDGLPLIPGHEGVGIVEQVGPGVTNIKIGDRVGVPWLHSSCGYCEYCLTGRETLCELQKNTGFTVNGAFSEYMKADARYVVKVPDNLRDEQAAPIFCAGVATYRAMKVSGAKPGEWVAVFGLGGLGHLAVQYGKAMGLKIVGIDIHEEKIELARELGADLAVNGRSEDPAAYMKKELGGVHAAVCVAVSQQAYKQAYRSLRKGGTLVMVGLPSDDLSVPIFDMVHNQTRIVGSADGIRQDLIEALQFASEGKVSVHVNERPIEQINEIFADMEAGYINGRVVVKLS